MWLLGVARQEPSHRWGCGARFISAPTMTCMTASYFQREFPCTKYSTVPRAIPLAAQDTPQVLPQLSSRRTQAGHDGFMRYCSIATAAREAMIGAATVQPGIPQCPQLCELGGLQLLLQPADRHVSNWPCSPVARRAAAGDSFSCCHSPLAAQSRAEASCYAWVLPHGI